MTTTSCTCLLLPHLGESVEVFWGSLSTPFLEGAPGPEGCYHLGLLWWVQPRLLWDECERENGVQGATHPCPERRAGRCPRWSHKRCRHPHTPDIGPPASRSPVLGHSPHAGVMRSDKIREAPHALRHHGSLFQEALPPCTRR